MTLPLLAWPGALAIGLSLGLLGSGGSILTVPVLVYLVGQDEKHAIAGSLLVVGVIALTSSLGYLRRQALDVAAILAFGLPGMLGTWIGAWTSAWIPGSIQLILFALVMTTAAAIMLSSRTTTQDAAGTRGTLPKQIAAGLGVGAITGLVGVGGGFLIVPALVAVTRLDLHRAIGTSLAIITLNSAVGFAAHATRLAGSLDWNTLAILTAIGIAGGLLGQRLASRLPQAVLRRIFAIALIVLAIAILAESGSRALRA